MTAGLQPLLPGELRDGWEGHRSARDWLVDVSLFVFAAVVGIVILADTWSEHGTLAVVLDIVAGVAALAALWVRRSHPVAVGIFAVTVSVFSALAGGAAVVALFNATIRAPRRGFIAVVALSPIGVVVFPLVYPGGESFLVNLIVGVLLTAVVVGWGLFARARRQLVLSLRERAARLLAEQRMRVEQAREAERRRIAREMHDVLAHRVSLLSLHAGALEFRPDASAEEIAEAAAVIRAAAQAAQQDLREVIGVLREGGNGTEPPQPTLAQIPALIEESRAAGMRLSCRVDVPGADELPAAVGRTAYRIVQEGLTNARKQAPGAAVDVTIAGGDPLVVQVVSRRPVGVAVGLTSGAGSGLIGLAERVGLAGGTLEHGSDAGRDFGLRATLPSTP